ncbi:UDP-N-acetylmuramate dehydrogenase [Enterococcus timonensis]|uniref:UDP-N-acetylmuramate dehydrogenase n=1 Tax=Enterococcus timonensis TaxID=1852364 RepID=UPI000ADE7AA0|nr:UDP-N-acetylmuramate dehydrogenase [Enterococcus timonensis]
MTDLNDIIQQLAPIKIIENAPLAQYTFTKTGGPVDYLIFPKNADEIKKALDFANLNHIPWQVLGNASNLIVRDGGIRGFVFMLTDLVEMTHDGNNIYAQAGARLSKVTQFAGEKSLTGFEFACGIPGSVGGAIYMNAGAYGGEIANVLATVDVITPNGEFKTYTAAEIHFAYRHSDLQETGDIIIGGTFALQPGDQKEIFAKMKELTVLRELKQPLEYPSCGSVFKRPEGFFTGRLIQQAGLQGKIIGGAQVSEKHAGFIVNLGTATATDYLNLIALIQKTVFEKSGINLVTEVRILGEEKNANQ